MNTTTTITRTDPRMVAADEPSVLLAYLGDLCIGGWTDEDAVSFEAAAKDELRYALSEDGSRSAEIRIVPGEWHTTLEGALRAAIAEAKAEMQRRCRGGDPVARAAVHTLEGEDVPAALERFEIYWDFGFSLDVFSTESGLLKAECEFRRDYTMTVMSQDFEDAQRLWSGDEEEIASMARGWDEDWTEEA